MVSNHKAAHRTFLRSVHKKSEQKLPNAHWIFLTLVLLRKKTLSFAAETIEDI